MKILHVGGYAPVTQALARYHIAHGNTVKLMCVSRPERVFDCPPALVQMKPHLKQIREEKFDIVHFHRPECFLSIRSDDELVKELKSLKRAGAVLVYSSYGCDSTREEQTSESFDFVDPEILACLSHVFIGSVDQVAGAQASLKKKWSWLPIPVKIGEVGELSGTQNSVRIVHIPSGASSTDSDFVVVTVGLITETKLNFEFEVLDPRTSSDLESIQKSIDMADIVIEQVMRGSYGYIAAAAMAAGKVVLSNYSAAAGVKLVPELKDCPVVQVDRSSLGGKLQAYISEPGALRHRAQKSLEYAKNYHSVDVIGHSTIEVYNKVLSAK